MHKRQLGKNHLAVSAIGLGCWGMSHAYGAADEQEALATLEHALDLGINFLDTADVYGDGHNETLIAKVLKTRQHQTVVATKFGFVGDEHGRVTVNGSPAYVRQACEQSLQRLGIDVIDLYYLHRRDPAVPIEETVGAMADLIQQGKVRFLGLSEVSATTLRRAHAVHPITALQSEYSLWHRQIEQNILPTCLELGISLVPFSPLGRGYLTCTIHTPADLAQEDYRRHLPRFKPETMTCNQEMLERLHQLSLESGYSPAQLALAWLLAQHETIVPIPGMKQRRYLPENIAATDISLSPELMTKLATIGQTVTGPRHNAYNLGFIET